MPGVPEPLSSFLDDGAPLVEAQVWPIGRGVIDAEAYPVDLEPAEDDTYLTAPLPPGEYEILLRYPAAVFSALRERLEAEYVDWRLDPIARLRITVDSSHPDRDPDGKIDLGTIPQVARFSVPGRVVVRSSDARGLDLGDLPVISLRDVGPLASHSKFVSLAEDGTFDIEGVNPGLFSLIFNSAALPDGWYVAAARSGARDVLWNGLEAGGPVNPLEIVLADDAAEIAGVVRNSSNELVPDARIVLIPPAGRRGPLARFQTVVADASGAYSLTKVPPGEYRMLALDAAGQTLGAWYWEDPERLRELELRGARMTVDPGARLVVNTEAILAP